MTDPLDPFRRAAKDLKKAYEAGATDAIARVAAVGPRPSGGPLKHADFLHVIAQENTFISWPAMTAAIGLHGLDRATKRQRLRVALHNRQAEQVVRLISDTPDLAAADFALLCGLYDADAVRAWLDQGNAPEPDGDWTPLSVLCKSPMFRVWSDKRDAMLEVADLLLGSGADVNAPSPVRQEPSLSPLYWALGHAGNLDLARWLLENGATPDDGESLYHATELGQADGLRLLLEHGATVQGTNALPRALDFDDLEMVTLLLEAGADPNEGSDSWTHGTGVEQGVPVLHQAARRMNSGPVLDALLRHGADGRARWKGHSAYAFAAVFGNLELVQRLEALGQVAPLSPDEAKLAAAARGEVADGYVNPDKLPEVYRNILREIVHLPGKLPHLKALVAIGLEWDRPDAEGLTPVQVAGWSGLPEVMGYFLSLKPDLSHVNGYGGTLFSTILHGAQNNPARAKGDYLACLKLALDEGVALPKRALSLSGPEDVRQFLCDWAEAHPGQVVDHGPV